MLKTVRALSWWALIPPVCVLVLVAAWGHKVGGVGLVVVGVALVAAVVVAVHHAEVVAHHVGEPFGALILAVAVTAIEVGLIIMLMTSGPEGPSTLARDTVFAAFMIVCNGVVGLCLLVGGLRHREVEFHVEGVTATLATLSTVAALALVLPSFTTSSPGPTSRGRSSPSPAPPHSCCTRRSSSCRPSGTGTTSCRWRPMTTTRTAPGPVPRPPGSA